MEQWTGSVGSEINLKRGYQLSLLVVGWGFPQLCFCHVLPSTLSKMQNPGFSRAVCISDRQCLITVK